MNDPLQPKHCAEQLRTLSAPERLRIIRLLRSGPLNVSEISDALDVPLVNLSHHLMILRNAGFVQNNKQGRFVVYSLCPGFFECAADGTQQHLNLGCCRLELPPDA